MAGQRLEAGRRSLGGSSSTREHVGPDSCRSSSLPASTPVPADRRSRAEAIGNRRLNIFMQQEFHDGCVVRVLRRRAIHSGPLTVVDRIVNPTLQMTF